MKYLILIPLLLTGCIITPNDAAGPGSVTQSIKITQKIAGQPLGATTQVTDKGETTGGIVINFISYERDKVTETADDNSQAKNAVANDTLKVPVK